MLRPFQICGAALPEPTTLRGRIPAKILITVEPVPGPAALVTMFPLESGLPPFGIVAVESLFATIIVIVPTPLKAPFSPLTSIMPPPLVAPIPVWTIPPLVAWTLLFKWRFRRAFADPDRPCTGDRKIFRIGFFWFVGVHPEAELGVTGSEG
ncbi:MAG: hypothetical protein QF614_07245 [SAR324 cluster bacterium]|jgi:hypothetical protein|nr:hypothetical protein [SAR324 cluster bacterium]